MVIGGCMQDLGPGRGYAIALILVNEWAGMWQL
jgi:hypothetical protein